MYMVLLYCATWFCCIILRSVSALIVFSFIINSFWALCCVQTLSCGGVEAGHFASRLGFARVLGFYGVTIEL